MDAHLQVKTPSWDLKVRCTCGEEFTSRCEFWRHQALAYEASVIAQEEDRGR